MNSFMVEKLKGEGFCFTSIVALLLQPPSFLYFAYCVNKRKEVRHLRRLADFFSKEIDENWTMEAYVTHKCCVNHIYSLFLTSPLFSFFCRVYRCMSEIEEGKIVITSTFFYFYMISSARLCSLFVSFFALTGCGQKNK